MAFMVTSAIITENDWSEEPKIDLKSFDIDELTKEQLVQISNQNQAVLTSERRSGKESGIEDSRYKNADSDSLTYSANTFNGIGTLLATKLNNGTVSFDLDFELISGEAKIYIVMDDEIVEYISPVLGLRKSYSVTGPHNLYVKLVAKDAEIKISILRDVEQ